jgi:tRNA-dihydrouridine synthase B
MTRTNLDFLPRVCLAPMAGITDPPFRRLVQEYGVSALWTEMINARGFLSFPDRFGTVSLKGHITPTFFQLFGSDPTTMALAAKELQNRGASCIDINMGCPVKKVVKKGAGASLMRTPRLAAAILAKVRSSITIPLSVKIRAGWDEQSINAGEFAEVLESEGADLIVVHCRTRSMMRSGEPKLDVIADVKSRVRIPVIGNGGIKEMNDATRMLRFTGCDGVMIGRGALGRPWFPGRTLQDLENVNGHNLAPLNLGKVVKRHFELQHEENSRKPGLVKYMRKHLAWYSKGCANSSEFRRRVMRTEDLDETMELVEELLGGIKVS